MKIGGSSGEVLAPGDAGYNDARTLWNAMVDKRPVLIARCGSTRDVVAALAHARRERLDVAVRGGGHSVAGHSCVDGGVMIDLRPMNRVDVDPDARRARVGGGALLGEFDRATHVHGLATTGGMVHHTGVGGLTLGGGFGWLARLFGLACDNLVSAEMVTADGHVVRASGAENEGLFWGIRGGGGNFGIVTEFEFQLHPIGPVLSTQLRYSAKDARIALGAFRDVMEEAPRALCGLAGMETGRGSGRDATPDLNGREQASEAASDEFYVWMVYAGSDVGAGAELIEPLRSAARPIAEEVEVLSYPQLQSATGEGSGPGRRHYWKGSMMGELSGEFLDAFVDRGARSSHGCGIELFSLGGAISDLGEEDTAYSNRRATFDLLPAATWDHPADDERNIALTRENWERLAPFATGGVYVNDLGADEAERVDDAYGSRKVGRLVALKDRWDPQNVFHRNANVRPSTTSAR